MSLFAPRPPWQHILLTSAAIEIRSPTGNFFFFFFVKNVGMKTLKRRMVKADLDSHVVSPVMRTHARVWIAGWWSSSSPPSSPPPPPCRANHFIDSQWLPEPFAVKSPLISPLPSHPLLPIIRFHSPPLSSGKSCLPQDCQKSDLPVLGVDGASLLQTARSSATFWGLHLARPSSMSGCAPA